MKSFLSTLLFFGFFAFFMSCSSEEEEISPLGNVRLDTGARDIEHDDSTSVRFIGIIYNPEGLPVIYGHILSKFPEPTLANNIFDVSRNQSSSRTIFTSQIEILEKGTYYVRSYATDGFSTIYGHTIEFEFTGGIITDQQGDDIVGSGTRG